MKGTRPAVAGNVFENKIVGNKFSVDIANEGLQQRVVSVRPFITFFCVEVPNRRFQKNVGLLKLVVTKKPVDIRVVGKNQVGIVLSGFNGRNFSGVAINFNITGMKD